MATPSSHPPSSETPLTRQRRRKRHGSPSKGKKRRKSTKGSGWRVLAAIAFLIVALLAAILVVALHMAPSSEE